LNESNVRSLVKTLSWRLTGSTATFLISWIVAGSWQIASAIAVIQITANTVLYYFHERIWNCIHWGRS